MELKKIQKHSWSIYIINSTNWKLIYAKKRLENSPNFHSDVEMSGFMGAAIAEKDAG